MIDRTIAWSVANRWLVIAASLALAAGGAWAMRHTPLDAIPDLSDVQVIIRTEWPGRSPDLVEDQITYPIVTALVPTPGVRSVRGFTDFGVSSVYVIFEDGTDARSARSRVLEYLQGLRTTLPDGVTPAIGPEATGVGWVFQYALVDESGGHTLDELRSLQDWKLRNSLASIPGVVEVASIGGFVWQYQVNADPGRLSAYNLSIRQVVEAIRASNSDAGGSLLEFAGREYMVRARGYLTSLADIEEISLGADAKGTPVRVGDVADVRVGPEMRRGVAELDGRGEAVGGIVIMRVRENALRVIDDVKTRLAEIRRTLPAGVTILPVYDRPGGDRYIAQNPPGRDGRRLVGRHRFPVSFPVCAHSDRRASDRVLRFLHPRLVPGRERQHHVPWRPRARHRCARRRLDCDGGKRLPPRD
jgi:Cu(I)/Ag(I) efflux system membrane protein CusA/SilA